MKRIRKKSLGEKLTAEANEVQELSRENEQMRRENDRIFFEEITGKLRFISEMRVPLKDVSIVSGISYVTIAKITNESYNMLPKIDTLKALNAGVNIIIDKIKNGEYNEEGEHE